MEKLIRESTVVLFTRIFAAHSTRLYNGLVDFAISIIVGETIFCDLVENGQIMAFIGIDMTYVRSPRHSSIVCVISPPSCVAVCSRKNGFVLNRRSVVYSYRNKLSV
jgi:hypothetical protein